MTRIILIASFIIAGFILGCDKSPAPAASSPAPPPASPSASPATPTTAGGPQWSCAESTHDFGSTWQTTVLKHPFEIKNTGNETLRIVDAKASCGCSMAENYTPEIPPGGTGVIPFSLNTAGKSGAIQEHLTIKTNASQGDLVLTMRGTVKTACHIEVIDDATWAGTTISPEAMLQLKKHGGAFGAITANTKLRRVLKLTNSSGQPLTLTLEPIDTSKTAFRGELKQTKPNEEYELTITAEPPYVVGQQFCGFVLKTNVAGQPTVQVPATAYVPPRIDVNPSKIIFDPNYSTQPGRYLTIMNHGRTPLKIKSISSSDPKLNLTVRPAPGPPGRAYSLAVVAPGPDYRPPAYGEIVRIETDDAEFARIDVPVVPTFNKKPIERPASAPLQFHPGTISTSQPTSPILEIGPPPPPEQ